MTVMLCCCGCSQPQQQGDYQMALSCAQAMTALSVQRISEHNPSYPAVIEAAKTFVDRALYEGKKIGKAEAQVAAELKSDTDRYLDDRKQVRVPDQKVRDCRDQL
ncbi:MULTISPECIES: hypothetical protein [Sphingomonas]|uniref:Uncharacterized protein n=1 Tax=Sphingomonas zeae TaxID=1646122 RepID=A0A7Y6B9E7_9SPHN|nr:MULTISPECIES: hypothetical protein [Sphingomonas]MBB4046810.1 hypothetical protein [Sphingomonas zeae]MDK8184584.1 hypothetical protein [Sphingomonas zeae]MDK8214327.1 hypothetical protein [Sphingomonas sp. UMB7805-LC452B]NUU48916.1 hypothetical protein [Sphingomonas zeae]